MSEHTTEVGVGAFAAAWQQGTRLADVRSREEYASGHVPAGAADVPLEDVLAGPQRFAGGRGPKAAEAINAAGARAVSVSGGTSEWIDAGHEIEKGAQQ